MRSLVVLSAVAIGAAFATTGQDCFDAASGKTACDAISTTTKGCTFIANDGGDIPVDYCDVTNREPFVCAFSASAGGCPDECVASGAACDDPLCAAYIVANSNAISVAQCHRLGGCLSTAANSCAQPDEGHDCANADANGGNQYVAVSTAAIATTDLEVWRLGGCNGYTHVTVYPTENNGNDFSLQNVHGLEPTTANTETQAYVYLASDLYDGMVYFWGSHTWASAGDTFTVYYECHQTFCPAKDWRSGLTETPEDQADTVATSYTILHSFNYASASQHILCYLPVTCSADLWYEPTITAISADIASGTLGMVDTEGNELVADAATTNAATTWIGDQLPGMNTAVAKYATTSTLYEVGADFTITITCAYRPYCSAGTTGSCPDYCDDSGTACTVPADCSAFKLQALCPTFGSADAGITDNYCAWDADATLCGQTSCEGLGSSACPAEDGCSYIDATIGCLPTTFTTTTRCQGLASNYCEAIGATCAWSTTAKSSVGFCSLTVATKKTVAVCSTVSSPSDYTSCPDYCDFDSANSVCIDPACEHEATAAACNAVRCSWDGSECATPAVEAITAADAASSDISTAKIVHTGQCTTAGNLYVLVRWSGTTFAISEPTAATAAGGMFFTVADLTDSVVVVKVDDATTAVTLAYQCHPDLCPSLTLSGGTVDVTSAADTTIALYAVSGHTSTACSWTVACPSDDTTQIVTLSSATGTNAEAKIAVTSTDGATEYLEATTISADWIKGVSDFSLTGNSVLIKITSDAALTSDGTALLTCATGSTDVSSSTTDDTTSAAGFAVAGAAFASVLVLLALF